MIWEIIQMLAVFGSIALAYNSIWKLEEVEREFRTIRDWGNDVDLRLTKIEAAYEKADDAYYMVLQNRNVLRNHEAALKEIKDRQLSEEFPEDDGSDHDF